MDDEKVVAALVAFEAEKESWRITGAGRRHATRRMPDFTDTVGVEDRYDDSFLIHDSLDAARTHINLRAMEAALKAVGLLTKKEG